MSYTIYVDKSQSAIDVHRDFVNTSELLKEISTNDIFLEDIEEDMFKEYVSFLEQFFDSNSKKYVFPINPDLSVINGYNYINLMQVANYLQCDFVLNLASRYAGSLITNPPQ